MDPNADTQRTRGRIEGNERRVLLNTRTCHNPGHDRNRNMNMSMSEGRQIHTMTVQRQEGKQRLKTQTLTIRQGTGGERGGRRPGVVTRGKST